MEQTLFVLLALTVAVIAGCSGQKPAVAANADTTAACCDSAALASCCRSDPTGAGCGGCATPAAPTDTAPGTAEPCPSGS